MRKIILICALCVAAFGFFKSCSEYETYEEREKCRKETGKMIGEGAVALSEIMSKAPGDYLSEMKLQSAASVLLEGDKKSKISVAMSMLGQSMSKKQALKVLTDGCYNTDKVMSKSAAQQYYTAQKMMKLTGKPNAMLNLSALANPKTRNSVKMVEVSDEQLISDKSTAIWSSCLFLAAHYKNDEKKANNAIETGAKKICALSPKPGAQCIADTKQSMREALNEMMGKLLPATTQNKPSQNQTSTQANEKPQTLENIVNGGAEYALKYLKGDESAYATAYEALKYACDKNDARGCYNLYVILQRNVIKTKNISLMSELNTALERSCKQNYKNACDVIKKYKDAEIWDK